MDEQGPVIQRLDHISETLDELLAIAKHPRSAVVRTLEIAAVVMGVLSIVGIIDTILKWITGG